MDLAYLRAHPAQLPVLLTHQRIRETPVPGGSVGTASRLTLDDGASVFLKTRSGAGGGWAGDGATDRGGSGKFPAEAEGLRWLRRAGTVAVPDVIAVTEELLAVEWVEQGPAGPAAAERFGRELAGLHRCGAPAFGAPWPGFIGLLPQDNTEHTGGWPEWFAAYRLEPHLRTSADRGALDDADVALVRRVLDRIEEYDTPEPPARIHGDLWPGNLLWNGERAWLIDPAAQGGHRETDLATLALFGGAPHLDRILGAYREEWPLTPGWAERVPVHQLHLLLVHTALFGASYRAAVVSAADRALRTA